MQKSDNKWDELRRIEVEIQKVRDDLESLEWRHSRGEIAKDDLQYEHSLLERLVELNKIRDSLV